jgi:beta-phosphoglucomutase-like phosphatase (HAD superfamily)
LVKAILWDMDGVLADTGEAHYLAWQTLYAERGQSISYEQFAATFGMANPPIIRLWLGEDVPEEELQRLSQRKEELFRANVRGHVRLLPGVLEWLARGRERGYRQVVPSSGPMANIIAVVGVLDVADYLDALISGAFLPKSKPDPAIFLRAAATVGASPRESLVIEDGIVGVEAAVRAGMRCVAVTTTHPAHRLAQADLVVGSLAELAPDAFDRLLEA